MKKSYKDIYYYLNKAVSYASFVVAIYFILAFNGVEWTQNYYSGEIRAGHIIIPLLVGIGFNRFAENDKKHFFKMQNKKKKK